MLNFDMNALRFDAERGTVVVVAQDAVSGRVLMVAHADREALEQTVRTGEMHYRSRTRGLWRKGATSGNTQRVISLTADCDADVILARVVSGGPACHTGQTTCFGEGKDLGSAFSALGATIEERAVSSAVRTGRESYTQKLLGDRNLRLKKLGEEAAELVAACADGNASRAAQEAADLIYHIAVALKGAGTSLESAGAELFRRSEAGKSEDTAKV